MAYELKVCPFCKNTGVHMCPDVAEPVLIRCSHKECPITQLQDWAETCKTANRLNFDKCSDIIQKQKARIARLETALYMCRIDFIASDTDIPGGTVNEAILFTINSVLGD